MSVAVNTIPNSSATAAIGSCSGKVTCQNLRRPVAPSMRAASSTSGGIEESPARKITVAKGRIRQAWTAMIESFANVACPSHCGGLNGSILPVCNQGRWSTTPSSQLTGLYR